jgi:uncharacterized protein (TIGR02594 family)
MFHCVTQGETLSSIAFRYGVHLSVLERANPGVDHRFHLATGEYIYVPMETRYHRPVFGGGDRPTQSRPLSYALPYSDAFSLAYQAAKHQQKAGAPQDKHHGAAWMKTAFGEIGVKEVAGKTRANPRILEYFEAGKYWGKDDSGAKNAWCGCFAAWVLKQNGYTPVKKAYRAKEWKNFGKTIAKPLYGALGVKSRKGGGHVSFVVGQNKKGDKLYMLGGNQDDKVQVSEYDLDVWEAFVVPSTFDTTKGSLPVYKDQAAAAGKEK